MNITAKGEGPCCITYISTGLIEMTDESISELFPALGRTFAIIIIGYLLAKFKFVTEQNASVLGIVAGKITLPAVLLHKLALMDLNEINWKFLGGVLIAKSLVFFGVFVVTLVFTRPISIGKPSILAIFCTHGSDFPLGIPICKQVT